jgi:hypothetical protein
VTWRLGAAEESGESRSGLRVASEDAIMTREVGQAD